jgi:ribose transport system ATP-binding protein
MSDLGSIASKEVTPALAVWNLSKHFGGARALVNAALSVLPGEVHGLLGENGSGKSTLIKILAGYHAPDEGKLEISGQRVTLPLHPGQFRELGLSFVHQDLALIPSLTVLENLRIGQLGSEGRWRISWSKERRRAKATFARFNVEIAPEKRVANLQPYERALLAIVRAVEDLRVATQDKGGVLVLDEPTAFLPRAGIDRLFSLVREIAATGASVLFVSHDLDEVKEITDRATVLRDGHVVGTVKTREASDGELVEMIIGHRLEILTSNRRSNVPRAVGVAVRGLSGGALQDIELEVHEGEVVALTGLAGSGFDELPYFVYGAKRPRGGELHVNGQIYDLMKMTPSKALSAGIALLPADRQEAGSVGSLSVGDNVTLPTLDRHYSGLWLKRRALARSCKRVLAEVDVRPNNPRMRYGDLSGGNQQKAMLGKWLQMTPKLLLLHEPTQGVDVGARQQIFRLIRDQAKAGACVLCASVDYEQQALIADRVLVFARGRIVQELARSEITKERIAEQCYMSLTLSPAVKDFRP